MKHRLIPSRVALRAAGTLGAAAWLAAICQATTVEPLGFDRSLRESGTVVVGRIDGARTFWGNPNQTWLKTWYDFRVEDVVVADSLSQGRDRLVLSYWGGVKDGVRMAIGCVDPPRAETRYLVLLRKDWGTEGYTPEVGLNQGLFRVETLSDGRTAVFDREGSPLVMGANGRIVRRWETTNPVRSSVTLDEVATYIRMNWSRAQSMEVPAPGAFEGKVLDTFCLKPDGAHSHASDSEGVPPIAPNAPAEPARPQNAKAENVFANPMDRHQRTDGHDLSGDFGVQYSTFGRHRSRPVINQFPASFAPWSPEDQYQMSKWNYYSDIFRVRSDGGTGTFGWPNDRNDLCGWPDSDTLDRIYGYRWGSTTLGITFYRQDSGNWILEADIALNPAYGWTLDDEWVYDGSSAKCFRRTMTHELGHVWGLEHQFNFLSVMNYSPSEFRAYGIPFMDDAEGARAAYSEYAQSTSDLGVYLFRSTGYQSWADVTLPASVVAGNTLTISNYHIENVGSVNRTQTTLEWYLTRSRNYTDPYYYLNTYNYGGLNRFTYFNTGSVSISPTVPITTPGQSYYVNAYIRNDGQAGQSTFPYGNNYGWSRLLVRVDPRLQNVSLADGTLTGGQSTTGTVTLHSTAGPAGLVVSLSDNAGSVVTVPGSVSFSNGQSSRTFTLTTTQVTSPLTATITASSNGVSDTTQLRIIVGTALRTFRVPGRAGQTVQLQAQLTRTADGGNVSGRTITFQVNGAAAGSAVTGTDGIARRSYTIPRNWDGNYTILADHAADNNYASSRDTDILRVSGLERRAPR